MRWLAFVLVLACATPASAQTLMPEWFGRASETWRRARVPQIHDRAALYRSAAPIAEAQLEGALLLCSLHVSGRWDLFADPDLRVAFSSGSRRGVLWGTENSRDEVFSIPDVDLRSGTRLRFVISDRDITFDERIGTVQLRYAGSTPMTGEGPHSTIECRAADPASLEGRVQSATSSAEAAVVHVEGAEVDVRSSELGRPTGHAQTTQTQLTRAAAYLGWNRDPVRSLRTRLEAAQQAFDRAIRTAVREAYQAAPRRGQPAALGDTSVTVRDADCGATRVRRALPDLPDVERRSVRCVVRVELAGSHSDAGTLLAESDFVDARGSVTSATHVVIEEQTEETTTVVLAFPARLRRRGGLFRAGPTSVLMRL